MKLKTRSSLWLPAALFGACWLSACGARFAALDPLDPTSNPALEHGLRFTDQTHGHRDFPRPLAEVWGAVVEALHAGGIPVPKSAKPGELEGSIDVERIWVQVSERSPGRTCVMIRVRDTAKEPAREEAKVLLDVIQNRLR